MKLSALARFVKSNNAGAAYLTFDVGFADAKRFEHAAASSAFSDERISQLYPFAAGRVRVFLYRPALVIKITIPRPTPSGGADERDFDGVQQYPPLLDLEIEDFPS